MYERHFGLRENPFSLTPNTRFFLNLPSHQEALNLIRVALDNGDSFIKVVGEVGSGKTLLCRKVLNALEAPFLSAYFPNPPATPEDLRRGFARELGLKREALRDSFEATELLNWRLMQLAREGKRVVLLVDEAQTLPEETIEALRLLTNLETETAKLFQVVLFGQPELDQLLARHSLRQLQQRITFACSLSPLGREAVAQYLNHRLSCAGYNGVPLFEPVAVKLLTRASLGIPRLLNILAHKALMSAYGKGQPRVGRRHVLAAVADTQGAQLPWLARYAGGWW